MNAPVFGISLLLRLANSGFGHSGTPSPTLPSLLFPSILPFLPGSGGAQPTDKRFGAYLSQKEQLWWQQFLCIFIRINLNFCTNTILLSSRHSVSLRAKHSVGTRGKVSGQGFSRRTKSPWSWSCWWRIMTISLVSDIVRRIWPICAFGQSRSAFDQLVKRAAFDQLRNVW